MFACKLQCRLYSFCAGVTEKHLVRKALLYKSACKKYLRLYLIKIRDVYQALGPSVRVDTDATAEGIEDPDLHERLRALGYAD